MYKQTHRYRDKRTHTHTHTHTHTNKHTARLVLIHHSRTPHVHTHTQSPYTDAPHRWINANKVLHNCPFPQDQGYVVASGLIDLDVGTANLTISPSTFAVQYRPPLCVSAASLTTVVRFCSGKTLLWPEIMCALTGGLLFFPFFLWGDFI